MVSATRTSSQSPAQLASQIRLNLFKSCFYRVFLSGPPVFQGVTTFWSTMSTGSFANSRDKLCGVGRSRLARDGALTHTYTQTYTRTHTDTHRHTHERQGRLLTPPCTFSASLRLVMTKLGPLGLLSLSSASRFLRSLSSLLRFSSSCFLRRLSS